MNSRHFIFPQDEARFFRFLRLAKEAHHVAAAGEEREGGGAWSCASGRRRQ
jgi:hypothetical protein